MKYISPLHILLKLFVLFFCFHSAIVFIGCAKEADEETNKEYYINDKVLRIDKFLHEEEVESIAFSPDGKMIAAVIDDWLRGPGSTDFIRFVNVDINDGGKPIPDIISKETAQLLSLTFSPNGQYLALEGGIVQVWDIVQGKKIFEVVRDGTRSSKLEFLPDNQHLAITYGYSVSDRSGNDEPAEDGGTVRIWDFKAGIETGAYKLQGSFIYLSALSPDGQYLATASYSDKTIKVWNIITGKIEKEFSIEGIKHEGSITRFTFSNNSKTIAIATSIFPADTGYASGIRIRLWDIKTGKITSQFDLPKNFDKLISFSKDDQRLIASGKGAIYVYDIIKRKRILNTKIIPGDPPVCFNIEKELIAFGTPYESHAHKELEYLLICHLKESYNN